MPLGKLLSCEVIPDHLVIQLLSIDDRIAIFPGFRSGLRLIRTAYADRISVFCLSSTGKESGVPAKWGRTSLAALTRIKSA